MKGAIGGRQSAVSGWRPSIRDSWFAIRHDERWVGNDTGERRWAAV